MKHTSGLVELPMHFWMQTLHKTGIFCASSFKLGELLTSSSACLGGHDGSLSRPLLPVPTPVRRQVPAPTYLPLGQEGAHSSNISSCLSLFLLPPCSSQFRTSLFLHRPTNNHYHLFTPKTLDHRLQAVPKTQASSVESASLVQSATCVRNRQRCPTPVEP